MLSELLEDYKECIHKNMPICRGIARFTTYSRYRQFKLFAGEHIVNWCSFSGNLSFFIPITDEGLLSPYGQFAFCNANNSFWTGEQGRLRNEALDFLIAKAKELRV